MKNNFLFKLLLSLPVILIVLYFIPFLGICLILFRYFVYNDKNKFEFSIFIVVVGLLILLPKVICLFYDLTKLPYIGDLVNSDLYKINFINYSKLLISVGVIFFIISFVLNKIFNKVGNEIKKHIVETQKRDAEILRKNDMEIKIKQEKAKNTSYVECPNCGSDNLLGEKFGTCKFCRSKLVNKNYKV